jgi:hypothetical protein
VWREVAVTVGSFDCESVGGWLSAVNLTRPNPRVDRSARSSFEVNLERHPRSSVTQSFGSMRLAWQRRNSCLMPSRLPAQRRRRAGGDAAKLGREAVLLVRAFGARSGTIKFA